MSNDEQKVVDSKTGKELVPTPHADVPTPSNNGDLKSFKKGVDQMLKKRKYFIEQVLPMLTEKQDYHIIVGKKCLAKGGAEKLATIYKLTANFTKDTETLEMLGTQEGLVAFICTLSNNGVMVGEGRGADTLAGNQNDANKTIKMAQKRAFVDAVIRTTGLSDIFTQDLEDMTKEQINDISKPKTNSKPKASSSGHASQKQLDYINSLCIDKGKTIEDLESVINKKSDSWTPSEASQIIEKLLATDTSKAYKGAEPRKVESKPAKLMKEGAEKVGVDLEESPPEPF